MGGMMAQHEQHFAPEGGWEGERALLQGREGGGGGSSNVVAKRDGYTKTVSKRPGKGGERGPVVARSSSTSMTSVNGKHRTIKETTLRYADGSSETVREEMK